MYLKNLSIINYKNIVEADLSFCSNVNCFLGNNGMGKTNILDAIYHLSYCKSFFNTADMHNIHYDEHFFVIQGDYQLAEQEERFHCGVKRGHKKVFKRNKKAYDRLADHISSLPLVMISPWDTQLIVDGAEERRRYLNGIIAQYDKSYLSALIAYNKALKNRNALLKQFKSFQSFDQGMLEPWDEVLIQHGVEIYNKRKIFIKDVVPLFQEYHQNITESSEEVSLEYESALHENESRHLFTASLKKDLLVGHTTQGVHRDDLLMNMQGHPLKRSGSQGQNKSYMVALRLAQFDFLRKQGAQLPILLLDDVFDKLDSKRVEQIVHLVADQHFGQIFITDTNREHLKDILSQINKEHRIFAVEHGKAQILQR